MMLGFLWFGACVAGFFMHSECLDKQAQKRAKELWERHRIVERDGGSLSGAALCFVFLFWVFIWQAPYGILPATSGWLGE